jgi:EmrB/QacA subfamily drug resistance transporter
LTFLSRQLCVDQLLPRHNKQVIPDEIGNAAEAGRPAELSHRRRLLVLAICCMSLFIVGLDVTIVNVALPSIGHELHAGVSGLQWTIDAYTLVLASLLMLSGSTADRIGRRRTFQTGLALFTAGSLLCSLAPGLGWLVAFRMLQAIGGSMLNPVAMSIITNTFIEPRERARAIGIWGGVVGLSMALGPITGGLLVETVGWRGIFWANVPVGIAALVLTALFVPESKAPRPRKLDPVGQLLIIVLLAALVYALIEGPGSGWTSPKILSCFGVALAALIALAAYEPRRPEPLIDPRFFRSAPFSGAVVIAICAFAALGGFLLVNTLYLQDVRGYSPMLAGVYTLPMAAMTAICSPLSGRLVGARGARPSLLVAGLGITAAGVVLAQVTTSTAAITLLASYMLFGLGFGMVNAPITNSTVSGMPRSQAGVAAGVASTSRQVGSSLGVAVIGSATISALHGPFRTGFAAASHAGWWIVTGCGVVVFGLGFLVSGRWARQTAHGTASRLAPGDQIAVGQEAAVHAAEGQAGAGQTAGESAPSAISPAAPR